VLFANESNSATQFEKNKIHRISVLEAVPPRPFAHQTVRCDAMFIHGFIYPSNHSLATTN